MSTRSSNPAGEGILGRQIGAYRVESLLGQGGMGEILYRRLPNLPTGTFCDDRDPATAALRYTGALSAVVPPHRRHRREGALEMKDAEHPMPTEVQHPGAVLLERYLTPLGISPSHLARSIGVPLRQVSELIGGLRHITPDIAARLALFFDVPPRWWLMHQARYDAAYLAPVEELRDAVTPFGELSDVLVTPHGATRLAPARVIPQTSTVTFSEEFEARLRAQVEGAEDRPRTVSEAKYPDGTVALLGR